MVLGLFIIPTNLAVWVTCILRCGACVPSRDDGRPQVSPCHALGVRDLVMQYYWVIIALASPPMSPGFTSVLDGYLYLTLHCTQLCWPRGGGGGGAKGERWWVKYLAAVAQSDNVSALAVTRDSYYTRPPYAQDHILQD